MKAQHLSWRRCLAAGATVLLAVTLAACGTSGPGGGGDGQTLNLWYLSDNPTVANAVERFEAANEGWTVNLTDTPNDQYKTKLRVGLGTENGPDVFFNWGGADLIEYEKSNLVIAVDDLMEEKDLADAFSPVALEQGQVDGTQYALATAVEASMVWYNTEIFAELGLSVPETWEEFLNVIAETKAAGHTPIAMANASQWPGSQWWSELVALACGPDFWATIGTESPEIRFDDACVVEAHEKIVELVEAGAFNDGFNGLDYDKGESRQLFWAGNAAMNHMGNWTITSAAEEAPEMLEKMDFFTVPAWSGAEGTSDMMTGGLAPMYSVAGTTEAPEQAKELLYYLVNQDAAAEMIDIGRVPVYQGTEISDPLVQKVAEAIEAAPALAPWPDHILEPEWTTEMLQATQSVFGLSMSPQEAAAALQAKYEQVHG